MYLWSFKMHCIVFYLKIQVVRKNVFGLHLLIEAYWKGLGGWSLHRKKATNKI